MIDGADHLFSAKPADDSRGDAYWVNQELQDMVRSCRCPVVLLKEPPEQVEMMMSQNMSGKAVVQALEAEKRIRGEIWLFERADYYQVPEKHNHRTTLTMKRRFVEGDPYLTGTLQFDPETLRLTELR